MNTIYMVRVEDMSGACGSVRWALVGALGEESAKLEAARVAAPTFNASPVVERLAQDARIHASWSPGFGATNEKAHGERLAKLPQAHRARHAAVESAEAMGLRY